MEDFERISVSKLLIRDMDMSRFFLKYAKKNIKYILKEEDNDLLREMLWNIEDYENSLTQYFKKLQDEFGENVETIEVKRNNKRKKRR